MNIKFETYKNMSTAQEELDRVMEAKGWLHAEYIPKGGKNEEEK